MRRVLVLDGAQRSALAAVRSLGRRGVPVRVGESTARCLAGQSRYASATLRYPDPVAAPEWFVDALLESSPDRSGELLLPMTDGTMMALLADPRLDTGRLLCAPREAYEAMSDKASLVRRAFALGIQVPDTYIVTNPSNIMDALQAVGMPAVIKPSRSKYWREGAIHTASVRIVCDLDEADTVIRGARWLGTIPALIQRYIPGEGAGVFALFDAGQSVAWFAHRRVREKPPQGGVSVLSESAAVEPHLQSIAERLLGSVRWSGVAMVEFRVTPEGEPFLMEVNGRFWGSLQLAIDSGVDFPWLLYQVASRAGGAQATGYTVGRRLHWMLGDLDSLLIQLRQPGLARPEIEGWRATMEFAATCFSPRARSEVFRWSDPLPGVFELGVWLGPALGFRSSRGAAGAAHRTG